MEEINLKTTLDKDLAMSLQSHLIKNEIKEVDVSLFFEVIEFIKKDRAEQLILSGVVGQSEQLPFDFVKWYSGMEEQKILNAYKRWQKEKR